jgi:spermidine synthase
MRVGVVGLGTGTIATYARPGDLVRFYEINDHVIDVARRLFSYVTDCRGRVEVAAGDARLSLEREPPQAFDVLVLDAFSGDAIPTHLLTTEAFDTYDRQLDPQGSICIHVSNRYLDLTGVVQRLAERHHYQTVHVDQDEIETQRDRFGVYGSDWIVLSKNAVLLSAIDKHVVSSTPDDQQAPLWTDAQTDLFTILK